MEVSALLFIIFIFILGLKLFVWLIKAGIFLVILPLKILFLLLFAVLFLGIVPAIIIPTFIGVIIPLFPLLFLIVGIILLAKYAF